MGLVRTAEWRPEREPGLAFCLVVPTDGGFHELVRQSSSVFS